MKKYIKLSDDDFTLAMFDIAKHRQYIMKRTKYWKWIAFVPNTRRTRKALKELKLL